ncbi:hypothetical protein N0V93_006318 [Gnomoniopsis smithogilvyi]|uniref:Proteinase n=1 Tax=Gnomoniopsis smithogilvyi TaxID=1191159 RepID=A0A9W8YN14_9PEZI|nr:hypothetical protein N0V93_006318 [Gnomoniopsis smithogilvyi]
MTNMKSERPAAESVHNIPTRRRRPVFVALVVCLTLWLLVPGISSPSSASLFACWRSASSKSSEEPEVQRSFRWSDITPSRSLEYTPCFGAYQCARLSVPLNWNVSAEARDNGPRAAIAIAKLPAKVPVTDPRYGGVVMLNPGGPGESGVFQVISDGPHLQTVLDSPVSPSQKSGQSAKYFDILSFDPRGVNNTTPELRCFPDAFNKQTWQLRFIDMGLLWDSESIVGLEWARSSALGASCSAGQGQDGVLPFINTAQVVEDMVEIIEQEGELRAREAARLLASRPTADFALTAVEIEEILQRTAYRPGQEKLQYWGMSYGTTVGSTFAAMHPDKVHRLLLDGNMDPADHYAGLFEHSLQDADMVITKHSQYCYEAGPEKCPLYDSSPEAIEARMALIMESIKAEPIAVPLPESLGPEVLTRGDFHMSLLGAVYFPFALAEQFWGLLGTIASGNASHPSIVGLAKGKQSAMKPAVLPGVGTGCDSSAGAGDPGTCLPYQAWAGAFASVSCMDAGGGPSNLTREAFRAHRDKLAEQSRWVSPTWTRNRLMCEGISAKPAWRPSLKFEKQEWDNTSHPLLIIGNTHDPATPLANGQRLSRDLFPGSVVLLHDSEGHCSHANPSLCTAKVIREYFQTGELPEAGTVCAPERKPFLGCVRPGGCHFDSDDARLWEALVELSDTYGFSKKHDKDEEEQAFDSILNAYMRLGRF